jgi:hypothetical protein
VQLGMRLNIDVTESDRQRFVASSFGVTQSTDAYRDSRERSAGPSSPPKRFRDEAQMSQPVISIGTEFRLTALGEGEQESLNCRIETLVGHRLTARVPKLLGRNTCVKVDCGDAFVLGEVLDSWEDSTAIFSAIKLREALVGLQELAESQAVQSCKFRSDAELSRGA